MCRTHNLKKCLRISRSVTVQHPAQASQPLDGLTLIHRSLIDLARVGRVVGIDHLDRQRGCNRIKQRAQQVCILYAVVNGFLSQIPVEQIRDFEDGLHKALANEGAGILDAIRSTKKLDESTEAQLKDFLTDAVASYLDRH